MREESNPYVGTETGRTGDWDQLKHRARQSWGNLTDDDLDVEDGDYDGLVGRISDRTGESEEDIRRRLGD